MMASNSAAGATRSPKGDSHRAARSAAKTYSIGLTTYAEVVQLDEWIRRAEPGATAIYAIGQLGKHPSADLARQAFDDGKVNLKQERAGQGFKYIIEKRRASPVVVPSAGVKASPSDFTTALQRELFLALVDCAEQGLPCPSLSELAELFELNDRQAARHQLKLLVKSGLITAEGDRHGRVVTIVETGIKTAERRA